MPKSWLTGAAGLALLLGLFAAHAEASAEKSFMGTRPPEIDCRSWVNTEPLTLAQLIGRGVLIEFWSSG